jgi:hypothetical protein
MGVLAVAALARVAERLFSRSAARWTVVFAATNVSVAYYARTSNLDGPALMWTALAVERLVAAPEDARALRWFCVYAALAVATKDQAYAPILFVVPFAVAARGPRAFLAAAALGAGVYLVAGGAALNPTGFVHRVTALFGPASGDYRAYARDVSGLFANLADVAAAQGEFFWPWPIVALAWVGVVLAARRRLALVPLLAGLGSVFALSLLIGRAEHRFVLPLGFFLALYAGRAAAALGRGWALAAATVALAGPVALAATQIGDARRGVEAWLARQPRDLRVETYGPLCYLPRFAPGRATRVGAEPVGRRDPMPGMTEALGVPGDAVARRPDAIVLTEGFAKPYLLRGRTLPAVVRAAQADAVTRDFVAAAVADAVPGYHLALVAEPPAWAGFFGAVRIHETVGMRVWVLARDGVGR